MEAQVVVADPNGRGSVALWVAPDLRLRVWRWAVHLHFVLNLSKSIFALKSICPGSILSGLVGIFPRRPIDDLGQGFNLEIDGWVGALPLAPNSFRRSTQVMES